jgi:hypothetical protein
MNRFSSILGVSLIALALIVSPASAGLAGAASSSCGGWSVVPSPNRGPNDNTLGGVSGASSADVWAVGSLLLPGSSSITGTLVDHWNGTTWSVIPSANVGSLSNALYGVSARTASDAWAVGSYIGGDFVAHTLIQHWEGSSWTVVTSPDGGPAVNVLYGVAAVAADNVWAVGRSGNANGTLRTLIEHWDGSAWSVVASPNPGATNNLLNSIVAVSANDIWAVGQQLGTQGPDQGLILHWNGTQWSVAAGASTTSDVLLYSVGALGNAVTAVGDALPQGGPELSFAEQFMPGQPWTQAPTPNAISTSDNILYAVAATSGGAWAVGNYLDANGNFQALIEQWNGTSWSIAPTSGPGSGSNILGAVTAVSANDVWAVGSYDNGGSSLSLIEHFC